MKQVYHPAQLSLFTKTCICCHQEKDRITEFEAGRNTCKQCRAVQQHFRYHNPKIKPIPHPGYKFCTECHEEKLLDEFHKQKLGLYGCESKCKDCRAAYQRVRRNTPEYREYDRIKHQENKAYYQAYYLANREAYRFNGQAWRKANPEKAREIQLRRQAHKLNTIVEDVNYAAILERDGAWCYLCEKPIDLTLKPRTSAALTFDHVIPLQPRKNEPQGVHTEGNIKPVHMCCNVRKGNKPLESLTPFDRRGPAIRL